jgi:hypothetical protein
MAEKTEQRFREFLVQDFRDKLSKSGLVWTEELIEKICDEKFKSNNRIVRLAADFADSETGPLVEAIKKSIEYIGRQGALIFANRLQQAISKYEVKE